mmetsp:Transcript_51243/g.147960  ORF Transcript_51243/g.147960 Transcript_51243/m.147960 type:complete len:219 (+) Transcript_51243:1180-1836(+)
MCTWGTPGRPGARIIWRSSTTNCRCRSLRLKFMRRLRISSPWPGPKTRWSKSRPCRRPCSSVRSNERGSRSKIGTASRTCSRMCATSSRRSSAGRGIASSPKPRPRPLASAALTRPTSMRPLAAWAWSSRRPGTRPRRTPSGPPRPWSPPSSSRRCPTPCRSAPSAQRRRRSRRRRTCRRWRGSCARRWRAVAAACGSAPSVWPPCTGTESRRRTPAT